MSGRDFKSFLASHKAEIGKNDTRLVTRFLSGHKPTYKQIDYSQLYAVAKIKKSSGDRALRKVEKLSQQNKSNKERQLIQEHKRVWEKEMQKLKYTQTQIENDIKYIRPNSQDLQSSKTSLEELYEDIIDYEDKMQCELHLFTKNTLQPVHELQADIKLWLAENRSQLLVGAHDLEDEQKVNETIQSVKEQQDKIIERLEEEEVVIEDDVYDIIEKIGMHTLDVKLPKIKLGIPKDLLQLECPDGSLRESCLNEFDWLDQRYTGHVELLEDKYENAINRVPLGGWNELDHLRFKHIINQYKDVSSNRRKLYMDRLKRELPYKTIEQLSNHEDWWFSYRSFQSQLKDLFNAWKRDKDDLTLHVVSLFQQACVEYNTKTQTMIEHTKQKFVCNFLHEKLFEYQTERLEQMKLEAAHRAQKEEEERKNRKMREMKEKERRERDKQKVKIHKEHQERLSAKLRDVDQKRKMEMQEIQNIEQAHNLERVQYRKELFNEKLEHQKQQQHEKKQEIIAKEKRLQALRDQVLVQIEDDPERLFKSTQAFKAHVAVDEDEEQEAQTPLFTINTYSVEQIANDKRLKVENALRRANLHMTDYARQVLKGVQPPSHPRKDTLSTAFQ